MCVCSVKHREVTHKQLLRLVNTSSFSSASTIFASLTRRVGCKTACADLGVVGLLNLLLVDADLILMLGPQLAQGLGQLALKVLLAPAVDLHHAGLVAALGLAQFLHVDRVVGAKRLMKSSADQSLKCSKIAGDAIKEISVGILITRQHLSLRRPIKTNAYWPLSGQSLK